MMNSRLYKRAMESLKFDAVFENRILDMLENQKNRGRIKNRRLVYARIGIAVCAVLAAVAVIIATPPQDNALQAAVQPPARTAMPTAAAQSAAPAEAIKPLEVVRASDYGGDLASYMAPEPGQVIISEPVRRALADERNKDSLFFVRIHVLTPEHYANSSNDYLYNGHSISEWNEMVDLSTEAYPYNEYNGDHGGNVTIEQWEQAQERAKKIDAQENRNAAMAEYQNKIMPTLAQAQDKCEAAEIERLSRLGYNVFMQDTTTDGTKRVFAALLTKDQLLHFHVEENCGYFIDWVYDIDGIVEWEMRCQ